MIDFAALVSRSSNGVTGTFRAASLKRLDDVLRTLDAALSPGPYLFGDRLTVCDICLAIQAVWPEIYPGSIEDYAHLKRMVAQVTARPAVQRVLWKPKTLAIRELEGKPPRSVKVGGRPVQLIALRGAGRPHPGPRPVQLIALLHLGPLLIHSWKQNSAKPRPAVEPPTTASSPAIANKELHHG